ncbi:MAG: PspC domain-containing protein [Elusimicrobia bacterium]|nr:PspC domain-containing protein [Elusimicrobiota bacterium]
MTEKKLHRCANNRWLAGVCGGIAEFFGLDATLVRIAWVFLTLYAGSGIILYLVCWLIMPWPPEQKGKLVH